MSKKKPYFSSHFHIGAFVTPQTRDMLNKVLSTRGLNFTQWLHVAISRDACERLPESQGGVKRIIPPEVAEIAREKLEQEGDFLYQLAKKTADPVLKKELLAKAGPYYDGAAFFGVIVAEVHRRKHVIGTGQRQPRHRKNVDRKPATDINSST